MTELRILLALTVLLVSILAALIVRAVVDAENSAAARGCRASGGAWHLTQRSCTWDQP